MIELHPPTFPSTAVHSLGWEPIKSGLRGNIHVQFQNKDGQLTQRGYYKNVQRAIYAGLEAASKPGVFIHQNLKDHFEWVRLSPLEEECDPTLPDVLVIPSEIFNRPDYEAAYKECVDSQRIKPERLFT